MYKFMRSLAEYIALVDGNFEEIWQAWSARYRPPEEMVAYLQAMGRQLCQIDKRQVMSVPERAYRAEIIKNIQDFHMAEKALERQEEDDGGIPEKRTI